jgi:hypothetical protein
MENIMRLYSKSRLSESINIPFEGIFWIIDDELIAIKDSVNPNNPYECTDLLHRDSWKYLKDKYLVNDRAVNYDYFPRGRVETLVIQDRYGNLDHYEANVYLDKCVDTKKIRDEIESEFRLYLSNVVVNYPGQLYIDGSHYTCYNCK